MKHYLDAAEKAARAAGKLLRKNFRRPQRVNAVAAHDIKLEIDVQAQELITRLLLKEFPKHALYGEEGMVGDQSSEHQWVVDPLDGTVNYFYGIPHFCTSIALRLRNEVMVGVIYDPIRREMWKGQKGEIPKLNGDPIHVSDRADLAEAVVSIGLAKTAETINTNFPLLQQMIHRVRKCSAARRSTWLMSPADDSTLTLSRELACGTSQPAGCWLKMPVELSIFARART
jgi:myo-inositol-1(or 4)-monophosphatase